MASTLMNNESSRSHSIFTVTVEILEKGARIVVAFSKGPVAQVWMAKTTCAWAR